MATVAAAPQQEPTTIGCRNVGNGFVSAHGGCYDTITGLVWSADNQQEGLGLRGVVTTTFDPYSRFVTDSVYGGYDDWRLPTRDELMQLSRRDRIGYGSLSDGTAALYYVSATGSVPIWSSTSTGKGKRASLYTVQLGTGTVSTSAKTNSLVGLAVRYVGPSVP